MLHSAWRAAPDGRLATTRPSVSVRVYIVCMHARTARRWHLNVLLSRVYLVAAANTCKCNYGIAQVGAGCPVHGAEKCAACVKGWTINHAGTKCIRTCAHVRMCRESLERSVIVCVFVCVVIVQRTCVLARMGCRKSVQAVP